MNKRTLLTVLMPLVTIGSYCQSRSNNKDSILIKQTCEAFYGWYGGMTVSREIEIFNPQFVRTLDGMTTLDFAAYRAGLKRNHFTDDLIERRIKNFDECVKNLGSIAYDDFLEFKALDQFEEIKCDFNNRYEFAGGMEWVNGGDLTDIEWMDDRTARVTVSLYSFVHDKKSPRGHRKLTLTKKKKKWRISDI